VILDVLEQWPRYTGMHPRFAAAFAWIAGQDWTNVADGKHSIEGGEVFALVSSDSGRGRENSPLEYHHRYIDIQCVITGDEMIGWQYLPPASPHRVNYDAGKDIGFLQAPAFVWIPVARGQFAILFPTDAHAPLAGTGPVRKAVIKVAVEQ
jgi:biofilm protein TabA